jgi:putative salt-induced outer membrane protein YdiY
MPIDLMAFFTHTKNSGGLSMYNLYLFFVSIFLFCSTSHTNQSRLWLTDNGELPVSEVYFVIGEDLIATYKTNQFRFPFEDIKKLHLQGKYRVTLKNNTTLIGTGVLKSRSFLCLKIDNNQVINVSKTQIKSIKTEQMHQKEQPKIKNSWNVNMDLGYQNQTGNLHSNKFHYYAQLEKHTDYDGLHITATGHKGNDLHIGYNEAGSLKVRSCLKYQGGKYHFVQGILEYDKVLAIDLRTNLSIGTRWTLHKTSKNLLMFSVGIGSDKEIYTNDRQSSSLTGLAIVDFKKAFFGKTWIEGNMNFYPTLDSHGELKADSRVSWVYPVSENTSFKLTAIHKYFGSLCRVFGVDRHDNQIFASYSFKL